MSKRLDAIVSRFALRPTWPERKTIVRDLVEHARSSERVLEMISGCLCARAMTGSTCLEQRLPPCIVCVAWTELNGPTEADAETKDARDRAATETARTCETQNGGRTCTQLLPRSSEQWCDSCVDNWNRIHPREGTSSVARPQEGELLDLADLQILIDMLTRELDEAKGKAGLLEHALAYVIRGLCMDGTDSVVERDEDGAPFYVHVHRCEGGCDYDCNRATREVTLMAESYLFADATGRETQ